MGVDLSNTEFLVKQLITTDRREMLLPWAISKEVGIKAFQSFLRQSTESIRECDYW